MNIQDWHWTIQLLFISSLWLSGAGLGLLINKYERFKIRRNI
jgi:hypothetical protein